MVRSQVVDPALFLADPVDAIALMPSKRENAEHAIFRKPLRVLKPVGMAVSLFRQCRKLVL
ncbi:MAG: hypothetical protein M1267_04730 [Candidatus Thermoplasmatota archaeon]|jgi:hypothetical protein|nr:hypothetical protein [Candidatus Thermoplasmatota archaeon]MCL5799889.1 hypothetical protein [Candidatus Thermoplasmatota archaeon]